MRIWRRLKAKAKAKIIAGVLSFCFFVVVTSCDPAFANTPFVAQFKEGKPTFDCLKNIAYQKGVPLDLLLGINSVEMGRTGQRVRNSNQSYDIGAFQINSIHLPHIYKTYGVSEHDLATKGCLNAYIAGDLLKKALNEPTKQHLDFFSRASGYHSWTNKHNQVYRQKLITYTRQWQQWLIKTGNGHLATAPKI